MKLPSGPVRRRHDDGMLPLVNLVFLLMILFLLIGAVTPAPPFAVEPAASKALPPAAGIGPALWIDADGRLGWNGQVIAAESLADLGDAAFGGSAPDALAVYADRDAPADQVVRVLEALRETGVERTELRLAPAAP